MSFVLLLHDPDAHARKSFNDITHCHTYYAHINCNWKTGMDAFCEAYHVPTIHAGSFPGLTDYWQDDVAFHGEHRSIAFY